MFPHRVSLIAVGRLFVTSLVGMSHKFDFWVGYQLLNMEAGAALIVACLPNLRAVVRLKLRSARDSTPAHTGATPGKSRSSDHSRRGRSDNLSTADTLYEPYPTALSKLSPIESRTTPEDDSSMRELLAMPSYPLPSFPPPALNCPREHPQSAIYVEQRFSVQRSSYYAEP
jgi:hypothetical protein